MHLSPPWGCRAHRLNRNCPSTHNPADTTQGALRAGSPPLCDRSCPGPAQSPATALASDTSHRPRPHALLDGRLSSTVGGTLLAFHDWLKQLTELRPTLDFRLLLYHKGYHSGTARGKRHLERGTGWCGAPLPSPGTPSSPPLPCWQPGSSVTPRLERCSRRLHGAVTGSLAPLPSQENKGSTSNHGLGFQVTGPRLKPTAVTSSEQNTPPPPRIFQGL